MTAQELRENRFFILFDALLKGIKIRYIDGNYLSIVNNKLYLSKYNNNLEEYSITEARDITLQSLLDYYDGMDNEDIKTVYSSSKLRDFQDKIIKRGNN